MKYTYLLVNLFSVLVPFLFSFHPRIRFDKKFPAFFLASFIVAACFLCWDVLFTRVGVWGFNEAYTVGLSFLNLPAEEILFFICIPFACVFTYDCLRLFFIIQWKERTEKVTILILSSFLFVTGILFYDRLYTSVAFISTSLLIILLKFVSEVTWLPRLFTVYPLLLIPFFVVNGILTGTGINQPVVWYNNSENLGIRMLTIPLEDVVYGFELILLNVFFFEKFQVSLRTSRLVAADNA